MTEHRIIFGDSRSLRGVADKSVRLIVASPPLWQTEEHGAAGAIGSEDSYEAYINDLNLVWQACDRVLADGCRLCIHVGDQFARQVSYGRYKVIPIRTEIIRFCETLGMDYMGAVIWRKTAAHASGAMGSYPYPRNGILRLDYDFILIFKKPGDAPKPTKEQKALSKMTKEEWRRYFSAHWAFKDAEADERVAAFPEELPKRLIRMFSFAGEAVLDPFAGSGTTSLAAKRLGRNSIGYEIDRSFEPMIRGKLCDGQLFFDEEESRVFFTEETDDRAAAWDALPYRFRDPHRPQRRADAKALPSDPGASADRRETLYTVKHVFSPEKIELNDGRVVRLLGVRENKNYTQDAVDYLTRKFRRRKVFLRFDAVRADDDGSLLCYVYLDNRSCVNSRLIRTGFVDVDTSLDYSRKSKYLKITSVS